MAGVPADALDVPMGGDSLSSDGDGDNEPTPSPSAAGMPEHSDDFGGDGIVDDEHEDGHSQAGGFAADESEMGDGCPLRKK